MNRGLDGEKCREGQTWEEDAGEGYCKKTKLGLIGPQSGFQGVKGSAYKVPGVQGVGLQGPRGQGVGLQGLRGSRGRPTGSQGVKG